MRMTGGIAAKETPMMRAAIWLSLFLLCDAAKAQDIPGIELCTHETKMDRRTGCLQSNVEYLHQLVRKNAAESQQKLAAANNEITALKATIAALQASVAKLQTAAEKSPEKK
jgi:hypothetical protein